MGGGREVQEGGNIYTPMADSCQCMAETKYCNVIILQLKINKIKKLNPSLQIASVCKTEGSKTALLKDFVVIFFYAQTYTHAKEVS